MVRVPPAPVIWPNVVNGFAMGIIKDGQRFDPRQQITI